MIMASNDDDAARKLMYYLLAQKIFYSYEQMDDGDYDGDDDDDSDSSSVLEHDQFDRDQDKDDAARKLKYYLLAQKIFNSYEQTEDGDYDGDDDSDSSSVLESDKFEHDEDEDCSWIPRSLPRVASYFDCNMCLKLATEPLKRVASKNISQNAQTS